MTLRFCIPVVLLVAASAHGQGQGRCGVERWPVKTLADPQAAAVLAAPVQVATVAELLAKPAPSRAQLQAATSTRFPDEKTQYRIFAVLVGFKLEADQDFHIVVADPTDATRTLITEIPAPACVPEAERQTFLALRQRFVAKFGQPSPRFRRVDQVFSNLTQPSAVQFRRAQRIVRVEVRGVGFFDFLHGQTGVAPNGFELHPVLAFDAVP